MSQQEKGGFHTSSQLFFFFSPKFIFNDQLSPHLTKRDDYYFLGVCVCLQFYSQGYPSGGNCVWRWKGGARELERKPEQGAPG